MDAKDYLKSFDYKFNFISRLKLEFQNVSDSDSYRKLADEIIDEIIKNEEYQDNFRRENGFVTVIESKYKDLQYHSDRLMSFCRDFGLIKGFIQN